MAAGRNNPDEVPESLRKQLALAVGSIQWSYAIFWSISSRQPGVLEWGDGYYNGDIKTRKTVQAVDLDADQLGLQRTEQLRELYESLSAGETNPQTRRPSAALSPEDLTDTEWYFLVCMSFVFNIGQGLPGRTLANNQTIWLCNAHYADSKIFSRSLLAKSASIQTVLCFPYLGGVVELGVTELVMEDPNLVQCVKDSLLEIPYPVVSNIPTYVSENARTHEDFVCAKLDHNIADTNLDQIAECDEVKICSPNDCHNGLGPNQQADDSFMIEGINGAASQVRNWEFMDDEIINCAHNSMNSSDCVSQSFVNPEKVVPVSNREKVHNDPPLLFQECNRAKDVSSNLQSDDLHYQNVLSTLLKSSHPLILGPYFQNSNKDSSFVSWRKRESGIQMPQSEISQKLLKKVLFEVAQMHRGSLPASKVNEGGGEGPWSPEVDGTDMNLAERRRRERLNEKFLILGSLVPSPGKVDKLSILDHTIEYLKELKRRVEELESYREVTGLEARKGLYDTAKRTSDNCNKMKLVYSKRLPINKRKACDIDEVESEENQAPLRERSANDVTVSVIEKDVLIEMRCCSRECLLLEIMDAMSNLHLDCHTVQSSNADGILSLKIRAKLQGSKVASARMIRQALQRVVWKC